LADNTGDLQVLTLLAHDNNLPNGWTSVTCRHTTLLWPLSRFASLSWC